MKKNYLLLILFFGISLYGQYHEALQITNSDGVIHFSGEEAVRINDDMIYLTYYDELETNTKIMFAISENNGESFQYFEIDEMESSDMIDSIDEPVLEVLDNGSVIIIFVKLENDNRSLFSALYDENTDDFDIQLIEENISGEFHLIDKNGVSTLIYKSGDTDGWVQLTMFYSYLSIFGGDDVIESPVHSNSSIWIQQTAGGNNNGWPTFLNMVTTSEIFRKYPTGIRLVDSGAPMDQIFQGGDPGWIEYASPIELPETASEIRDNGLRPFAGLDAEIVYVKLAGSSYDSMLGNWELVRIDSFKVYSWFPHNAEASQAIIDNGGNWFEEAEHIWTNHIPIYELSWEQGPSGTVSDNSVWVESELWIEGEVSGMQIWGCADTVFITSDIFYTNTAIGNTPDDESNPNLDDYFGLVSEERILIKYKHIDPWTDELRDDNCDDVFLYGAYAALGKGDSLVYGDQAYLYDGIFSFEYHHPHGSTPDFTGSSPYTGNDTLYSMIDLHKYIYPGDETVPENLQDFILHGNNPPSNLPCGYPFESSEYLDSYPNNSYGDPEYGYHIPYGTDLPWYNPVWPESAEEIAYERGDLNIFGTISQRRIGFIHRSGTDPFNHDGNEWDIENLKYDGTHPSTGYYRNYHYDTRFLETDLIDFPCVEYFYTYTQVKARNSLDYGISFTEASDLYSAPNYNLNKLYQSKNEARIILSIQNDISCIKLLESDDDGLHYDNLGNIQMNINNWMYYDQTYLTDTNDFYLYGEYSFLEKAVNKYSINSNEIDQIYSESYVLDTSDFSLSNNGARVYCSIVTWESPQYISIYYSIDDDQFDNNIQWFSELFSDVLINIESELSLAFDDNDSLYFFLNTSCDWDSPKNLFLIKGEIDGITHETDDEIPIAEIDMNIYPNPFNPETLIDFQIINDGEVEIKIYDIKGQFIKLLQIEELSSGTYSVMWDGKDANGRPVSSGIYFCSLKVNGDIKAVRKCTVLK